MTKNRCTEIRARVSRSAITKMSRFFDDRDETILNELFQNSRRAGASRIEIWASDERITITDDGHGIEDPQELLDFGRSEWRDPEVTTEDPAGMGLFALARCGCRISSLAAPAADGTPQRPWTVALEPNHWQGDAPAKVEECADWTWTANNGSPQTGTRIEIPRAARPELINAIPRAGRYTRTAITLNGTPIEQHDFLREAAACENWEGVRIGVFDHRAYRSHEKVNFHGTIITDHQMPSIRTIDSGYHCAWDIVGPCRLELELPARRRIISNDALSELETRSLDAVYRCLAQREAAMVPYAVHKEAAKRGISIRPPSPELRRWEPECADYTEACTLRGMPVPVQDDGLVVLDETELTASEQQAMNRAICRARKSGTWSRPMYRAVPEFEGYQWYDALEKVTTARTVAVIDAKTMTLPVEDDKKRPRGGERPEKLSLLLGTVTADGTRHEHELPMDLAFANTNDDVSAWDQVEVLVTAGAATIPEELAEVVKRGFFCPSDESEADSYESQEAQFERGALRSAIEMIESSEAAINHEIEEAVSRAVAPLVPNGYRLEVQVDPANEWSARVAVALTKKAAEKPGRNQQAGA